MSKQPCLPSLALLSAPQLLHVIVRDQLGALLKAEDLCGVVGKHVLDIQAWQQPLGLPDRIQEGVDAEHIVWEGRCEAVDVHTWQLLLQPLRIPLQLHQILVVSQQQRRAAGPQLADIAGREDGLELNQPPGHGGGVPHQLPHQIRLHGGQLCCHVGHQVLELQQSPLHLAIWQAQVTCHHSLEELGLEVIAPHQVFLVELGDRLPRGPHPASRLGNNCVLNITWNSEGPFPGGLFQVNLGVGAPCAELLICRGGGFEGPISPWGLQ
mmetsp:Transcript_15602/g.43647  ORF Transcript_15602/g.43647 Transcript_15602/m.43647 type:complete len:267 (+) Transcript_15602:110-910(+)